MLYNQTDSTFQFTPNRKKLIVPPEVEYLPLDVHEVPLSRGVIIQAEVWYSLLMSFTGKARMFAGANCAKAVNGINGFEINF